MARKKITTPVVVPHESELEHLRALIDHHQAWQRYSGLSPADKVGLEPVLPVPVIQSAIDEVDQVQVQVDRAQADHDAAIERADEARDRVDDETQKLSENADLQRQVNARILALDGKIATARTARSTAADADAKADLDQEIRDLSSDKRTLEQHLDPIFPGSLAAQEQAITKEIARLRAEHIKLLDKTRGTQHELDKANDKHLDKSSELALLDRDLVSKLKSDLRLGQDAWLSDRPLRERFEFHHPRLRHIFKGAAGVASLPGNDPGKRGYFDKHPVWRKVRNATLSLVAAGAITGGIVKFADSPEKKPETPTLPGQTASDVADTLAKDSRECEAEFTTRDGADAAVRTLYAYRIGDIPNLFPEDKDAEITPEIFEKMKAYTAEELADFEIDELGLSLGDKGMTDALAGEYLVMKSGQMVEAGDPGCAVGDDAFKAVSNVSNCAVSKQYSRDCSLDKVREITGFGLGD